VALGWRWRNYYQTLRQCTKLYGGNVPNCTAAIYQTVRRQCTKLYGGNWRRGRGGTLTKYPGKSRKPKTPHRWPYTTNVQIRQTSFQNICEVSLQQRLTVLDSIYEWKLRKIISIPISFLYKIQVEYHFLNVFVIVTLVCCKPSVGKIQPKGKFVASVLLYAFHNQWKLC